MDEKQETIGFEYNLDLLKELPKTTLRIQLQGDKSELFWHEQKGILQGFDP